MSLHMLPLSPSAHHPLVPRIRSSAQGTKPRLHVPPPPSSMMAGELTCSWPVPWVLSHCLARQGMYTSDGPLASWSLISGAGRKEGRMGRLAPGHPRQGHRVAPWCSCPDSPQTLMHSPRDGRPGLSTRDLRAPKTSPGCWASLEFCTPHPGKGRVQGSGEHTSTTKMGTARVGIGQLRFAGM